MANNNKLIDLLLTFFAQIEFVAKDQEILGVNELEELREMIFWEWSLKTMAFAKFGHQMVGSGKAPEDFINPNFLRQTVKAMQTTIRAQFGLDSAGDEIACDLIVWCVASVAEDWRTLTTAEEALLRQPALTALQKHEAEHGSQDDSGKIPYAAQVIFTFMRHRGIQPDWVPDVRPMPSM